MKFLNAVFFVLVLISFALAQDDIPATPTVEEVYLAKDDGEGHAGEQVTEFSTTDIPIYCVVLLETNGKAVVKMNFVAVKVAGVRPETKVVTASYTTKHGQNRVNFTGRPEGKWVPGKYRVDLFVDGKMAKNVEFEIKGSGAGADVRSAAKYLQQPAEPPKAQPVNKPQ